MCCDSFRALVHALGSYCSHYQLHISLFLFSIMHPRRGAKGTHSHHLPNSLLRHLPRKDRVCPPRQPRNTQAIFRRGHDRSFLRCRNGHHCKLTVCFVEFANEGELPCLWLATHWRRGVATVDPLDAQLANLSGGEWIGSVRLVSQWQWVDTLWTCHSDG